MKTLVIPCLFACAVLLCGCRVCNLGKSVARNQVKTAQGIIYSDSLITDDGRSRLTGSVE